MGGASQPPRFNTNHHTESFGQGAPAISSLMLQNWIPDEVVSELIRRGNQAETTDGGIGGSAMLYNNPETEMMYGAGNAVRSVD